MAFRSHIEDMRTAFSLLDSAVASVNGRTEGGNSLDPIRVKAVFYALCFGEDAPGRRAANRFVECFYTWETRTRTVEVENEDGKFTDEELTQDEVVTLMKAALMSPSSKRSNSWQFVVIDDKEMLKELSHCKEQASSFIADAALAIVVMADPLASDVWIEDAAIASIMIQLQAEDLGLGSCWVQVRERFTATGMPSDEFVHGILDIPLQLQVLSVIAVGHKGMERKPFNEEHLQWEKIHINKFGGK